MPKMHNQTENKKIDRIHYDAHTLLHNSYDHLISFFSKTNNEMIFLKKLGNNLSKTFNEINPSEMQEGIVHLDIWYDNLSVDAEKDITIFDFDNCGNGLLILDVGYFCKQLFFIEQDKKEYEFKLKSFLNGYQSVRPLSETALQLIPEAGAAVFMFYLGVQAQRFDWSNIFLIENYLNMFVGRIKSWMDYSS
jgi:Ser/Thr protein kinase RdoA (MazF antagonist)